MSRTLTLLWRQDEAIPAGEPAARAWIGDREVPYLVGVGRTQDANTVNLTLTLTLPADIYHEAWVSGDIAGLPQPGGA